MLSGYRHPSNSLTAELGLLSMLQKGAFGLEMESPDSDPACYSSLESKIYIHLSEQSLGIAIPSEVNL